MKKSHSITSGSLSRAVIHLSTPMLIGALLQNLQSMVDLFWVGRLGPEAVASVSMAATVMMLMNPMIMGLATGTVAFVSRAVGAGDADSAGAAAGQSLFLSIFVGVIMALAGWWFSAPALRMLGAMPGVADAGAVYLKVCLMGGFTLCMLFIGNAALQGAGDAHTPMRVMALTNVLNIVMDPLLIFGLGPFPRMGVAGAALATVLAQGTGAVVVLRLLLRGRSGLHAHAGTWRPKPELAWRMLKIGLPGSGQMFSRSLMSLVLMGIVAGSGTAAVAAYGIGLRFHIIVLMPAFALGGAAATMMGQNLGAGQAARAGRAVWMAVAINLIPTILSGVIMMVFPEQMIRFFNHDPEVISIGARYLRIVSPFYLFACVGIILARGLNGAGDTVGPMIITIATLWGLQVPLAIYLARVLDPSTDGIWWAMACAFVIQCILTVGWFIRGRWKNKAL